MVVVNVLVGVVVVPVGRGVDVIGGRMVEVTVVMLVVVMIGVVVDVKE